ncbi:MAG TPA: hypothetical protein VJ508_10985 [Saprospiraceae bacterium]|nr:hypothetical protein [Saprospiraceae bacterium]
MNTNRAKTSSMMGFVISVLLHGIFFAGCFALDASSAIKHSTDAAASSQVNTSQATHDHTKPQS